MKYFKNGNNELFAFDKENSNTEDLIEITFDEVEAITNQKQIELDNNKTYVEKRRESYPPIGDQLDYLYHANWDEWRDIIRGIKEKYPKPTE